MTARGAYWPKKMPIVALSTLFLGKFSVTFRKGFFWQKGSLEIILLSIDKPKISKLFTVLKSIEYRIEPLISSIVDTEKL